jgi:YYY domain-containing protein
MSDRKLHILLVLFLVVLTLLLRVNSLNHGMSFHPDERHIVMTLEKMSWQNLNPDFFAYGSLPFYLGFFTAKLVANFLPWAESYDGLFLIGRSISVAFGLLSVLLTYLLTWLLFRKHSIAFVAGLILSCNVLHLQLSRFFAFDGILTALATASLIAALLIARCRFMLGLPLAGILLGLGIATKISALSLLFPLTVALVLAHPWNLRGASRALAQLAFIMLLAVIVFCATEPYAIINWSKFVAQNLEQIRMTRGDWRPPYTIQYWHTTPFLYPLEQMARWSFWWPAFLAFVIGLVALFFDKELRQKHERWILLAWAGVSFITIAGLQVKFPRYLLPIYPTLAIFAALGINWLVRLLNPTRWRKPSKTFYCIVASLFIIPSAIFAWSFHKIYDQPHSYQSASRWIYQNVPRGSAIVGFHWDDKIPLTLPGLEPRAYDYKVDDYELRIYELPDHTAKLKTVTDVLEKANYLAWPTQRIPGSLPRVPLEFPKSIRLLNMLYTGELGFKLIHTEKVRPTFFGFEWRSDSLDESFSVYDHPKVMIFKKVKDLSSEEMISRIESSLYSNQESVSREQLLEPDVGVTNSSQTSLSTSSGEPFSILAWLIIIELLAFFCWPLLACALPRAVDRGYVLSKTFGVLLFGFLSWYLALFDAIQLSRSGSVLIFLVLLAICLTTLSARRGLYYQLRDIFAERSFTVEGLFLVTTLILMVCRAYQPEIFWGEKPMDFGLLNYLVRLEKLPALDPWAAGHQLQYYYMGSFIIAQLIKLSGVSTAVGFNLALVLIGSLSIMGAYGILQLFTRRIWTTLAASVIFFFAGNIEVLRLWFENRIHSFDLFWASSRVLHSPSFAEYPLWSFLFGDLHAHVIAYPITLLVIGFGMALFYEWFHDERSALLPSSALYGLMLGTLFSLNTWDSISYSVFSAVLFTATLYPNEKRISWLTVGERLKLLLQRALVAVTAMLLVVIPFSREATAQIELHWGVVMSEEFNTLAQILLFQGHWYLLIFVASSVLSGIYLLSRRGQISGLRLIIAGLYLLIPTLFLIFTRLIYPLLGKGSAADAIPWPVYLLSSALMLSSVAPIIFPLRRVTQLLVLICGSTAALILIGSECLFLFDRMNTIFKFYSALGTLLSLSALALSLLALEEFAALPKKRAASTLLIIILGLVTIPVSATILVAGGLDIYLMTTFKRINNVVRPTLDGSAYLNLQEPEESALYKWINRTIAGTPVLLEAQGLSYAHFNRVQMQTGLPVVLGWEHHVKQRGVPVLDVEKRRAAIRDIYSTTDLEQALNLLFKYNVDYIVIGKLERATYPQAGLAKFTANPIHFQKLFLQGETELFVTPFSRYHPKRGEALR